MTETLTCPERVFPPDSGFLFVAADEQFNISWKEAYENSETDLARLSPTKDEFRFDEGKGHLIINDECLYDRIDIPPESTRACFPAGAQVLFRNGRRKRMDELRVGDVVLAGKGEYSRVVMFSHRSGGYGHLVEIRAANRTVRGSPGHLIRVQGAGLKRMGEMESGMRVVMEDGEWRRVEEVRWAVGWGMFNPQTEKGEIVVDGVVCSCYTDALSAGVAHGLLTPIRAGLRWATNVGLSW